MTREDGETIVVPLKLGQLFACANGCCCGRTEDGHAEVPVDLYDEEWRRRRLRGKVHLNLGGCLGPCSLANVALLMFDGHAIFFQGMNSERRVRALFDYVERLVTFGRFEPPTGEVARLSFGGFTRDPGPFVDVGGSVT